ncbi:pentapeptide repeat-containing protein [[Phormidium] sp. ETS-05]|uniref:pentapeptide repeat-containing protein n=1 Tax=[Phormidium] sp. ETS-05 TaxID=222819 RepID=UPI0018EF122B|nr:pentapeptide repeat-containing protein [[Phormidium] sp. ETS-05]
MTNDQLSMTKHFQQSLFAIAGILSLAVSISPAVQGETSQVQRNTQQLLNTKQCLDCNLTLAWLQGAKLHSADLRGANMREAALSVADLRGADLRGASLVYADLSGANLSGANLKGADLSGANLSGAVLDGTNLSGVNLCGANMPNGKESQQGCQQ